jgi:hypothetical protein
VQLQMLVEALDIGRDAFGHVLPGAEPSRKEAGCCAGFAAVPKGARVRAC